MQTLTHSQALDLLFPVTHRRHTFLREVRSRRFRSQVASRFWTLLHTAAVYTLVSVMLIVILCPFLVTEVLTKWGF